MRTRTALTLATTAAATSALATGGALVAAHAVSGPRRPPLPFGFTPFELDLPAQDVTLTAADGTRLAAWWIPAEGATASVILCHGHRGSRADLLGIGRGLHLAGFNVLLLDFRGNGDSADGPQSLAHYEQQDLTAAIDHVAARRPGDEISVLGYSMGAAVSLLVAAQDQRIAKVVADSSFADMRGVIAAAAALHGRGIPAGWLVTLTDWATGHRYGYRFADVQPVRAVARIAPRPLLLIHGTADDIVPISHLHQLDAAAGEGHETWTVEGAPHCGAYFADRPGYIARVVRFLRG